MNEELKQRLLRYGFLFPVFSGIQIDLNVVSRVEPDGRKVDASLCDHNCTLQVGGYECPSAFTLNHGLKPKFAPGDEIFKWLITAGNGLRLARDSMLRKNFTHYCQEFRIPQDPAIVILENLLSGKIEVNLFGGNPEMHPHVFMLIRELRARGFVVNFTTTGRKFLQKRSFLQEFDRDPPNLIAVSADDYEPIDGMPLENVLAMDSESLKGLWRKISPLSGQLQKFVEGIYTARLAHERGNWPLVLFNMVIHRRNLDRVRGIIAGISRHLPKALVNPYPGQSSFEDGAPLFTPEDLPDFEELVDFFIAETVTGNPNITKRLQYWLVLKSVLRTYAKMPDTACAMLSGYGIWQCFKQVGAGMYLQVGKANPDFEQIAENANAHPGGHAGCYWQNRTVTQAAQIESEDQIENYLLGGMQDLHGSSKHPCPGCSMPRLWFNMVNTELGMNDELWPVYHQLRSQYVGF